MQRNLVLREIQFLCYPERRSTCQKKVTNLDDFNKDVRRTVLDFYDRGEFPSVKKEITFVLKHKLGYQSSSSGPD
jgi:hypothetical protein